MLVEFKGKKIKLPDFLIIGAARSGTTSLYNYLKGHKSIFMPQKKLKTAGTFITTIQVLVTTMSRWCKVCKPIVSCFYLLLKQ